MKFPHFLRNWLVVACAFAFLQGCFRMAVSDVNNAVSGGPSFVNIISVAGSKANPLLKSYGRIEGPANHSVKPTDDALVVQIPASWGQLRVYAAAADATAIREILGIGQAEDLPALAAQSLSHTIEAFPELKVREVVVDLHVAPLGSGRYIQSELPITATNLQAVILVGIDTNDRKSPRHWWMQTVDILAHEMLHIQHSLSGLDASGVDNEVAAYLTGMCAQSWLTLDAKKGAEFKLDVSHPLIERVFPGLQKGRWEPHPERFGRELGKGLSDSIKGRTTAFAVMYHTYATDGVLNLGDRSSMQTMLDDCRTFVTDVPAFLEN